jgi:hypothetical protein
VATSDLFDEPPGLSREKAPEPAKPKPGKGRLTKPERIACDECYREAIKSDDTDKIALAMSIALYRLGAEPLNEMAKILLGKLEQEGLI